MEDERIPPFNGPRKARQFTRTARGSKHLRPFDPLNTVQNRQILLTGTLDHDNARTVLMQLLFFQGMASNHPIHLLINSYGGPVDDGLAILDMLQNMKMPVNTHCMGMAAGTAVAILAAGTRGFRTALPNALIQLVPITAASSAIPVVDIAKARDIFACRLSTLVGRSANEVIELMANAPAFSPEVGNRDGLY